MTSLHRPTLRALLLGCLLVFDPSCSRDEPAPAEASAAGLTDACTYAHDGECDEPTNCALGTDVTDCRAACTAGTTPFALAAACAHLNPTTSPAIDDSIGSHGKSGLTGHRAGALDVPSGANAAVMAHRPYRLYVPASYDPSHPWPVVINMPGHRVDIDAQAGVVTELFRSADANRFIVAFAEQERRSGDERFARWTD